MCAPVCVCACACMCVWSCLRRLMEPPTNPRILQEPLSIGPSLCLSRKGTGGGCVTLSALLYRMSACLATRPSFSMSNPPFVCSTPHPLSASPQPAASYLARLTCYVRAASGVLSGLHSTKTTAVGNLSRRGFPCLLLTISPK